ncbi:hypothetical protein ASPZODRAFT_907857 [Penicilliopsis zonata CBS 506.65]|uniref:F-box domain-containing protein n=1 Tax=Penicilliopsis zonata CBS 506.65 TaxID=1073090 RepID=A0A1L9S928_9EURO|nr:hypothetical protein ASPZODRAFT_907857 [Penicilliopsis zonata CBS 506.65]OJJ43654.1 hypothetical protein ASPZODRAFT_907857 [Penicilliopsis zonata CBS 506.65]
MSTALPNEVYLVVFGHVNATPSLAAVCRVSKYFHALCTPILYRDVYVQHITLRVLRILSQLPVKSRLCYTRHLTLGRYMQISENESAETTHAVFVMLAKMQGLRSIEISVELSNCIASATYSAKKRFGDAPDLPAMLVERCPRLRHASFHPWLYDTKVPRFRNLRTLNIAHIPDYSPTLIGDLFLRE